MVNNIGKYLVCLMLLTSWTVGTLRAESPVPGEYQVKAAMLYNMAKFVDWPPDAFSSEHAPLTVCILGKNPFGAALDALQGKNVRGRQVVVRQVERTDDIVACQILFISDSEKRALPVILGGLKQQSVLTVSDLPRFAQAGGIVNFVDQEGKVRFEINLDAAQQARLKISSQLLKLAKIVR